jgi:hypothetical protein
MPSGIVIEDMPASCQEVFRLLHDYDKRLEWDTLLRAAYLEPEFCEAALGAISVCAAKRWLGGIALRTQYVSFQPGRLAAVQMLNAPPFFESFAASIRHTPKSPGASLVTYRYAFQAKPRKLRFLLHPIMAWLLRQETARRLRALRDYFRSMRPQA